MWTITAVHNFLNQIRQNPWDKDSGYKSSNDLDKEDEDILSEDHRNIIWRRSDIATAMWEQYSEVLAVRGYNIIVQIEK